MVVGNGIFRPEYTPLVSAQDPARPSSGQKASISQEHFPHGQRLRESSSTSVERFDDEEY